LRQATQVLANDTLTAHEKLTKIDGLIPFPPTASAEQLGAMLGVSKQAVMKTAWWRKNRRGETQEEIDRRFDEHEKRRGTPIDRRRGNRQVISDNYILYSQRGSINGVEGTFEIGVRPSASGRNEVIVHRFFRPDPRR
jgi:hypothetical protein